MPGAKAVIPGPKDGMPDSKDVIPDSIRDPVQEFVIPDSIRDPVPRADWIADQVRNDKSVVSPEKLEKLGSDSNRNW